MTAMVAACGGSGNSAVPNPPVRDPMGAVANPQPPCIGGGTATSLARGTPCPHPRPWDIAVANPGNNSVTSYVISANGNVKPLATPLAGAATKINGDYGIYYDGDVNLFVVNTTGNTVNRYSSSVLDSGAGGNIGPDQQLTSSLLNSPWQAAENYNQSHNGDDVQYIVNTPSGSATPSVTVFTENAQGNAPVWYSIAGNQTGLGNGKGIAIDNDAASPNYGAIYVSNPAAKKVLMWLPSKQFPTPVDGTVYNVAPWKWISASAMTNPFGLDVDKNGYLYVVNRAAASKVLVFSPTKTGATTPDNTISDGSLVNSYGVAVYTDLRVFVTNDNTPPSVAAFSNGEGPSSPLVQLIQGSNTGLNNPASLTLRIGPR